MDKGEQMNNLNIKFGDEPLAERKPAKRRKPAPAPAVVPEVQEEAREFGKKVGKGVAGRLVMGCVCSLIVSLVMNLPYLRLVMAWVCKIVLIIIGDPTGGVPKAHVRDFPVKIERREDGSISIGGQPPVKNGLEAPQKPSLLARAKEKAKVTVEREVVNSGVGKVKKDVEHTAVKVKDTARKVEDKAERITRRLENLHLPGHGPGQVPTPEQISGAQHRPSMLQKLQLTIVKHQQEAYHDRLVKHAMAFNVPWEGRTNDEIKADVLKAYEKHGPNGQCPRCRKPVKVPPSGTQRYHCSRCGWWYSGLAARHMGQPPFQF
jgi:hypothetical protein